MIFSTFSFLLLFLPAVFLAYTLALRSERVRTAKSVLVVASLFFYWVGSGAFFGWFVASVLFNYVLGRRLSLLRERGAARAARLVLTLGIVGNVTLLGYYKYANFTIFNLNMMFDLEMTYLYIVLPIGISFFTFQLIAYLVDSYRGLTSHYGLLDYLLFITFFPQLVVGPIVHHNDVVPQYQEMGRKTQRSSSIALGLFLFSVGCAKKLLLADPLTRWAQEGFDHTELLSMVEAWAASVSYTLSYYFDLSGYADMAIGLGLLFGISLPINFNSPYKARNFADYWQRWHITLSRFLGDYVFRSIYKKGGGSALFYVAIMGTFLVSGFWHGAGWTFVVWGVVNGVFVAMSHAMQRREWALPLPLAWGLTFLGVVGVRVLFVSSSFGDASDVFVAAFDWSSFSLSGHTYLAIKQPAYMLAGLAIVFLLPNSNRLRERFRPDWRHALVTAGLMLACLFDMSRPMDFLYFQF
ncbi:MAG: MBOAT family protein [Planctomycetota bacterium]|nr:MAG: MBOAT family protein [Planctomycetota bacterium]